jgi:hypothetical protein
MSGFLKFFGKLHPVVQGSTLLCLVVLVVAFLCNPAIVGNLASILKSIPAIVYMPQVGSGSQEEEKKPLA